MTHSLLVKIHFFTPFSRVYSPVRAIFSVIPALLIVASSLSISGCAGQKSVAGVDGPRVDGQGTAALIREIKMGMTQDEVAAQLGSPHTVSKDSSGLEAWIFEGIATDASINSSQVVQLGRKGELPSELKQTPPIQTAVLRLGLGMYAQASARSSTVSGTNPLSVVIRFDESQQVRDFSYFPRL